MWIHFGNIQLTQETHVLWCHWVTLRGEPWEIFWKIMVEIGWKERDRTYKSISNCIYSSFHLSLSKHFSNISCESSKCTWLRPIVSSHLIKVKTWVQEAQVTYRLVVIQAESKARKANLQKEIIPWCWQDLMNDTRSTVAIKIMQHNVCLRYLFLFHLPRMIF